MTPTPLSDLDRSWVVEASAGTGKTTALVERIVEVIAAGTPVETIVAVTFTHAAAGNMKLRVRHELERRRAREPDPVVRQRLAEAARSLDRAFIGTIHAFCAQLLRRRPVEARIDPVFQELAQPDALRVFAGVFRRWIESACPRPPLPCRARWRASPGAPNAIAASRSTNCAKPRGIWRSGAISTQPWAKAPLRARRPPGGAHRDRRSHAAHSLAHRATCRRTSAPCANSSCACSAPARPGWWTPTASRARCCAFPPRCAGSKAGTRSVAAWEELKLAIEAFRQPADADLAAQLRDELWEVVGLYQQEKRRAGQLDFMDLLLCARDLLRHDGARADLQRVYQRIFVDEFQDTDPLQAEILLLLAAGDPAERDWRKAQPAPGKLYVVGDPKQSIYRFRRADARLFHRICQGLRGDGVGTRELTSSTRSTQAIQSFVNAAFENSIENYLPLEGGVEGPAGQPAIVALPMPYPYGTRNISNVKIDACSPNAVAAFIQWLCNESGWKVRDRVDQERGSASARSTSAFSSAASPISART